MKKRALFETLPLLFFALVILSKELALRSLEEALNLGLDPKIAEREREEVQNRRENENPSGRYQQQRTDP